VKTNKADIKVERAEIVLVRSKRALRVGWADASKALAAAGEGRLVWPEFGNEGDNDLRWWPITACDQGVLGPIITK
jgi:antitoxin MazE